MSASAVSSTCMVVMAVRPLPCRKLIGPEGRSDTARRAGKYGRTTDAVGLRRPYVAKNQPDPKEIAMKTFLIEREIPGASELTHDELRGITSTSNDAVASLDKPYKWL